MEFDSVVSIAGIPVDSLAIYVTLATVAFQEIRESKRATKEQKRQADVSLSNAYNMTTGYYSSLNSGGARSAEKEHEIAALWDEAARNFLELNESLANRLGIKSRFWREGAAWTAEQIKAAKIGLDHVRTDSRVVTR